ncbi:hypothetical protein NQ318_003625 [Aromia moschata]|uniref:Integrase zinc-binding domain-containing protein n=1 Tax=Aromia moschata TaxID=1265417 RepID=A0AAV8XAH0_9CUCU|nr:hypothetical protein NQ318_003625 [Aromia moschata]
MLKPPTYDGQSSWSMYRRQFEAAAKANGWTPQEMATSLVISLRGQALEILQSIPEEQQNDYHRIVGALEISPKSRVDNKGPMSPFKSTKLTLNASSIWLTLRHRKEFLEQIGIQTFIDGLLDTEMQQALRLGRHTTISDVLVAALQFKAAKEASRNYKPKLRQVTFDESQSLKETIEKIIYGTTIKGYWAQWSSFVFAMAYCIGSGESPDGVSAVYQLVLPKARIHQVLEELHSSPSGGHFGVTRTWLEDWDKLVPLFLLSYRSSQHESTTYTPSMLTSGREMKLPTDSCLAVHWKKPKSDLCQNLWRTCEREWTGSTDLPGRS